MKKDEKACPKCAETIKLAATRCKHCGAEVSLEEVESQKAEKKALAVQRASSRRDKKIDGAIVENLCLEIEDLRGCEIRPYEIQEISEEIEMRYDQVLERALFHNMKFVDKPRPLDTHEWPEGVSVTIDRDIFAAADEGVVPIERWTEIQERHDVTGVPQRIRELGLAFTNGMGETVDDEWERRYERDSKQRSEARRRLWAEQAGVQLTSVGPQSENQYGVLQGAANLAGGCSTLWGILFLLLSVVLIIFAIKEIFSELF